MQRKEPIVACEWCGRGLRNEYRYTCPRCRTVYCWVHSSRHSHKESGALQEVMLA